MAGYVFLGHRYIGYGYTKSSDNTFAGGLMVAPGQLYHMAGSGTGASSFAIDDIWNSHNTYNNGLFIDGATTSTQTSGISTSYASSYFTNNDLVNQSIPSGSISYGGYSDWRIPMRNEWNSIFFGRYMNNTWEIIERESATVTFQFISGKTRTYTLYRCDVVVTDKAFASDSLTYGSLLFPDNGTFNITTSSDSFAERETLKMTKANVEDAVSQGAIFMMFTGSYSFTYEPTSTNRFYWLNPETAYDSTYGNMGRIFGAAYEGSSGYTANRIGIAETSWWTRSEGGTFYDYFLGWGRAYGSYSHYIFAAPVTLVRGSMNI